MNFRYQGSSSDLLTSFRVEPGIYIPAVGELVTLESDDVERNFKVVDRWYTYVGFEGKLLQQIITVVVTD